MIKVVESQSLRATFNISSCTYYIILNLMLITVVMLSVTMASQIMFTFDSNVTINKYAFKNTIQYKISFLGPLKVLHNTSLSGFPENNPVNISFGCIYWFMEFWSQKTSCYKIVKYIFHILIHAIQHLMVSK